MENEKSERRKHRRAYFSVRDNIIGHFRLLTEIENNFHAPILNLSRGGLHFTLNKKELVKPRSGDRLRLIKIEGEDLLEKVFDAELEIKWVLGHASLSQIGYGCKFITISPESLNCMIEFIDSKY